MGAQPLRDKSENLCWKAPRVFTCRTQVTPKPHSMASHKATIIFAALALLCLVVKGAHTGDEFAPEQAAWQVGEMDADPLLIERIDDDDHVLAPSERGMEEKKGSKEGKEGKDGTDGKEGKDGKEEGSLAEKNAPFHPPVWPLSNSPSEDRKVMPAKPAIEHPLKSGAVLPDNLKMKPAKTTVGPVKKRHVDRWILPR